MTFSIRLTPAERGLAESYAKLHSCSLADAFKKALFEKIEDEYDLAVFEDAYAEYLASGKKTHTFAEVCEELGL